AVLLFSESNSRLVAEVSPAHRAAFDTMADLHDGLGVLAERAGDASNRRPAAAGVRRPLLALAATVLLAAGALLFTAYWFPGDRIELRTARGERLLQTLPDGSTVQLNTDTALVWHATDALRELEIELGGEVFVEVAKDAARPFVIRTDHGFVTAIGTAFAVHARAEGTSVNVLEGVVEVRARTVETTRPRRVAAGQRVEVTAGAVPGAVREALPDALAWREGRLVYDDVPLEELVAELNRYLPRRMTISDAGLAATRVSAVLVLSDQESMLRALAQVLPLDWVPINDQVLVLHPS
ncbi:MAG: FecR domain-containing protein, partial [Pseudomonadales bacterium]|nr:FecR domain-containing protein [Pseudomonadales bacterium]